MNFLELCCIGRQGGHKFACATYALDYEKAGIVTAIVNVTENFAQETTNFLAQPVRRSAQNQEARPQIAGKNADKNYLRGLAKRMADEALAGQLKHDKANTQDPSAAWTGPGRKTRVTQALRKIACGRVLV